MAMDYCLMLKHTRRSHRNYTDTHARKCFQEKKKKKKSNWIIVTWNKMNTHMFLHLIDLFVLKFLFDPRAHRYVFPVLWSKRDALICDTDCLRTTKGNKSFAGKLQEALCRHKVRKSLEGLSLGNRTTEDLFTGRLDDCRGLQNN